MQHNSAYRDVARLQGVPMPTTQENLYRVLKMLNDARFVLAKAIADFPMRAVIRCCVGPQGNNIVEQW